MSPREWQQERTHGLCSWRPVCYLRERNVTGVRDTLNPERQYHLQASANEGLQKLLWGFFLTSSFWVSYSIAKTAAPLAWPPPQQLPPTPLPHLVAVKCYFFFCLGNPADKSDISLVIGEWCWFRQCQQARQTHTGTHVCHPQDECLEEEVWWHQPVSNDWLLFSTETTEARRKQRMCPENREEKRSLVWKKIPQTRGHKTNLGKKKVYILCRHWNHGQTQQ